MDKLTMQTPDKTRENFAALSKSFPNAVTESIDENGVVVRAIDADVLRQEINTRVVSGKEERYQFTWPDKKKAVLLANTPIAATLRPCREESVDFNSTENLYIEGDNLDVLKLLRETYLNRVKMIYIDPPYNTGNDFIYEDDFSEDASEFLARDYQYDEDGNRMVRNLDSNGRFHTDWLNMMYPRLRVARDLLAEDGVFFISVDDNEVENLKKICNEIFGRDNCLGTIVRSTGQTTGQDSGGLGSSFDYIIVYAKTPEILLAGLPLTQDDIKRFENEDEKGKYAYDQMRKTGSNDRRADRPNMYYPVKDPDGNYVYPIGPTGYESCWRFERKTYDKLVEQDIILWKKAKKNGTEVWWPYVKYYLEGRTKRPSPLWTDLEGNKKASRDVRAIFDGLKVFDYAKPTELITRILTITPQSENGLILDFFSGSATTAHAVMQLNAEDGGKRKFIMVQLPEKCDAGSETAKAGYKTICEIGKERIRRAGAKIKAGNADKEGIAILDIGFRVLKLDSSNMKDVYYTPQNMVSPSGTFQLNLDGLIDNIKPDRNAEDLLFQVMLDLGLPLSSKIEQRNIGDIAVFSVADNYLMACFDRATDAIVTEIAKSKPYYAVFRDSSFAGDATLVNFEQIFKTYSPSTLRKVL